MSKSFIEKIKQLGAGAALVFMLSALCISSFALDRSGDSNEALIETGGKTKADVKRAAPNEIKIVSYNMRWRGGDDLTELIELLKKDNEIGGASLIGLQEVDRNKKRTNNTNTAKKLAEELGMHYAWAAPPPAPGRESDEEETGVAILSLYPLTNATRIILPNPGPGERRRVALGATVRIGSESLRVYSVHAETRISNEKRTQQLKAVLDDLKSHNTDVRHAVVLGDFNTIAPKDVNATSRLFTEGGFHTPFSNSESTWRTFIIELKLDWIWLQGFDVKNYGIDKKIGMSDHWPLWAVVKLSVAK